MAFGIIFAVSALYSYAVLVFQAAPSKGGVLLYVLVHSSRLLLAGSFSGLIWIGFSRVVTLLVPISGWIGYVIAVPYVLVTLLVFELIESVMRTGEIEGLA